MNDEIYKIYKHNPPHLFKPESKYFVTAGTYKKKFLLKRDDAKERLLKSLFKGCEDFGFDLEDWVILDNHYHVMLSSENKEIFLDKLLREVHKFTALWIKKNVPEAANEEKIFYNYWDTCIDYEKSYYARLNYIYYNSVKHGYVENPEEYNFGSYYYRKDLKKDFFNKLKRDYPFDKINVKDDF